MMNKTTNRFSSEVRDRAIRMVLEHEGEHALRWAAVCSIAAKIGCTARTLHESKRTWGKTVALHSYLILAGGLRLAGVGSLHAPEEVK